MTTNKPVTIRATYRIVTPVFCAGADQESAELRLPSFKGALRFWWRSLMWSTDVNDVKLNELEANLFGSSKRDVGQSKIRMSLRDKSLAEPAAKGEIFERGHLEGANYLAYGVIQPFPKRNKETRQIEVEKGELLRPMIPGGEFTVQMQLRGFSDDQQQQVRDALILLGTVGGLGSKARKGFGSLTITRLEISNTNQPLATDPAERLHSVLEGRDLRDRLPDWSAWSRFDELRVIKVSMASNSANELLDAIGREQVLYRSWGSNRRTGDQHETLGLPSEQNFKFDHDLSKQTETEGYPHRVAFGLPHNYQTGGVKPQHHDRRASPLFIHIDQTNEDASPVALLAFLPARFLPNDEKITAFNKNVTISGDRSFWYPIHGFLDRLIANGSQPANRPGYKHFPHDDWWKKQTSICGQEVDLGK